MFERSLQLLLHISKRFNPFQVLKLFLLLLEVTCVIALKASMSLRRNPIENREISGFSGQKSVPE